MSEQKRGRVYWFYFDGGEWGLFEEPRGDWHPHRNILQARKSRDGEGEVDADTRARIALAWNCRDEMLAVLQICLGQDLPARVEERVLAAIAKARGGS